MSVRVRARWLRTLSPRTRCRDERRSTARGRLPVARSIHRPKRRMRRGGRGRRRRFVTIRRPPAPVRCGCARCRDHSPGWSSGQARTMLALRSPDRPPSGCVSGPRRSTDVRRRGAPADRALHQDPPAAGGRAARHRRAAVLRRLDRGTGELRLAVVERGAPRR